MRSAMDSAGPNARILLHEDGSLNESDIERLESEIPRSKVLKLADYDGMVSEKLSPYPACQAVRKEQVLFRKTLDILLSEQGYLRYIDSDILFFRRLKGLFESQHPALFGQERGVVLCDRHLKLWNLTRQPILKEVNSGFVFLDTKSIDMDRMEWAIKNIYSPHIPLAFLAEQSLWAILFNGPGSRLISQETVQLATKIDTDSPSLGAIHFIGRDKNKCFLYKDKAQEMMETLPPLETQFVVPKTHTFPSILKDMAVNQSMRVVNKVRQKS